TTTSAGLSGPTWAWSFRNSAASASARTVGLVPSLVLIESASRLPGLPGQLQQVDLEVRLRPADPLVRVGDVDAQAPGHLLVIVQVVGVVQVPGRRLVGVLALEPPVRRPVQLRRLGPLLLAPRALHRGGALRRRVGALALLLPFGLRRVRQHLA